MRSGVIIVADIFPEHQPQMALAEDQHLVQALFAYSPDPTLGIGVRLWRSERCADHLESALKKNKQLVEQMKKELAPQNVIQCLHRRHHN